ncbi:MAG: hypothetical protein KHZ99_14115 [Clostridium sp.]|uniref:hypothetical protein n=1 Tax=Clostridium sp. TaxID=1506 RepID=UPI0025C4B178|nr:hypothetical protein [Clostridium sp.]MBS4958167.1 hypothetical protein [Clostridium sp.]
MKKEGFIIKCNACGAETMILKKKSSKFNEFKFNNKKIKVFGTNMEETYIACKCGNELVEG